LGYNLHEDDFLPQMARIARKKKIRALREIRGGTNALTSALAARIIPSTPGGVRAGGLIEKEIHGGSLRSARSAEVAWMV
jgi:hypothetical protein